MNVLVTVHDMLVQIPTVKRVSAGIDEDEGEDSPSKSLISKLRNPLKHWRYHTRRVESADSSLRRWVYAR